MLLAENTIRPVAAAAAAVATVRIRLRLESIHLGRIPQRAARKQTSGQAKSRADLRCAACSNWQHGQRKNRLVGRRTIAVGV